MRVRIKKKKKKKRRARRRGEKLEYSIPATNIYYEYLQSYNSAWFG